MDLGSSEWPQLWLELMTGPDGDQAHGVWVEVPLSQFLEIFPGHRSDRAQVLREVVVG